MQGAAATQARLEDMVICMDPIVPLEEDLGRPRPPLSALAFADRKSDGCLLCQRALPHEGCPSCHGGIEKVVGFYLPIFYKAATRGVTRFLQSTESASLNDG